MALEELAGLGAFDSSEDWQGGLLQEGEPGKDMLNLIPGSMDQHMAGSPVTDAKGLVRTSKFTYQTSSKDTSSFWQEFPSHLAFVALRGLPPEYLGSCSSTALATPLNLLVPCNLSHPLGCHIFVLSFCKAQRHCHFFHKSCPGASQLPVWKPQQAVLVDLLGPWHSATWSGKRKWSCRGCSHIWVEAAIETSMAGAALKARF